MTLRRWLSLWGSGLKQWNSQMFDDCIIQSMGLQHSTGLINCAWTLNRYVRSVTGHFRPLYVSPHERFARILNDSPHMVDFRRMATPWLACIKNVSHHNVLCRVLQWQTCSSFPQFRVWIWSSPRNTKFQICLRWIMSYKHAFIAETLVDSRWPSG